MSVPVMDIGPMGMGMGLGLMFVPVAVGTRHLPFPMVMAVVVIVVPVPVFVVQPLMFMEVGMMVQEEGDKRDDQEEGRNALHGGEALPQYQHG